MPLCCPTNCPPPGVCNVPYVLPPLEYCGCPCGAGWPALTYHTLYWPSWSCGMDSYEGSGLLEIMYQACNRPGRNPRQHKAMLMSESAEQMPRFIQTAIKRQYEAAWRGPQMMREPYLRPAEIESRGVRGTNRCRHTSLLQIWASWSVRML